jgi:hypothetical protein
MKSMNEDLQNIHPNFTGKWKFNNIRSTLQIQPPDSAIFVIIHEDPFFRLVRTHIIGGKVDELTIALVTNGLPVIMNCGPLETHSTLHWDGDELILASTFPASDAGASNTVRYRLEDNGQTLLAKERLRSSRLNYDNDWVFERC